MSSWCSDCHNAGDRRRRRERRAEALILEAEAFERKAAAGGLGAASSRSTAEALRRQAERELWGLDAA